MPHQSIVAIVALRQLDPLPAARLIESLGELWPGAPVPSDVRHREDTVSFRIGGDKVVVSRMPAPIPGSDLEGPCQAAWYWPEAAESLCDHAAHDLVVVAPGSADRRSPALTLTKVIAALVSMSPAAGVLWGTSGQVHAPDVFVEVAAEAGPDRLPIQLWIAFHLSDNGNTTHSLYTCGLEDFGYMEIEVVDSTADPQRIYRQVFNLAHYVLATESTLHHGETIGASDDEQIPITHSPSICDGSTTVVRVGIVDC